MGESLHDQIAALTEMVDRLPARRLPGPAIGEGCAGGSSPAQTTELEDRWAQLDLHLPPIAGRRVLVVGDQADADARAYATRGAVRVTVLDTPGTASTATGSPVQRATPDSLGGDRYDVVHCTQVLHRSPDPIGLLRLLRRVIEPTGVLVLALTLLSDPERSEYLRYLPGEDTLDGRSWFIPGRLAVRWMLQTAGFEVQDEFGDRAGPPQQVPVICVYLRAGVAAETSASNSEPTVEPLGDRIASRSAGADGHLPPPGS
jgi:SAM-dependent methyltransferase